METVYNCISDNLSLDGDGNIVLSTTCFTTKPLICGVMYGCTDYIMKLTKSWIRRCGVIVFHPLMLPIIFAELERKRLLQAADVRGSNLNQRVLEMDVRSQKEEENQHGKVQEKKGALQAGDSETINMLLSMNELKNGLEGLRELLSTMRNHLGQPSELTLSKLQGDGRVANLHGMNIDLRLKEMIVELQGKSRSYEGLLGAITLATQMVYTITTFPYL